MKMDIIGIILMYLFFVVLIKSKFGFSWAQSFLGVLVAFIAIGLGLW